MVDARFQIVCLLTYLFTDMSHIAQADIELAVSAKMTLPPASASRVLGITRSHHYTRIFIVLVFPT